jgi:hypothetical protein
MRSTLHADARRASAVASVSTRATTIIVLCGIALIVVDGAAWSPPIRNVVAGAVVLASVGQGLLLALAHRASRRSLYAPDAARAAERTQTLASLASVLLTAGILAAMGLAFASRFLGNR